MPHEKPNVLIVLTDQQSAWTLGCYGGTVVRTPHIDSLAAEGARFDQFFTPSAVCTPSRGCLMTGRYPRCHGAYVNNLPLARDSVTFAHLLQEAGYETGYVGKWHLDGDAYPGWMTPERSMGFADCRYMFNRGHFKSAVDRGDGPPQVGEAIGDETAYMTDWLADKAIAFMLRPRTQPFLCVLSIPDPHSPYSVRAPYDAMYAPEQMPVPRSFDEERLPDWAEYGDHGRRMCFPSDMPDREARLRAIKAQYCGEVKCIDDNVGKIIAALRQQGLYDRTVVVFLSDHGDYMGEHGLLYKNRIYETAYRVPFLIRWPARIAGGTVVRRIVSMVDFQPTLLSLVGLAPAGTEQGRDATRLLDGDDGGWTDEAFIHGAEETRAGIVTPQFQLTYVDEPFRDHVLFDRRRDPEQLTNLFADPRYRDVVGELTRRIVDHHLRIGSDFAELPAAIRAT